MNTAGLKTIYLVDDDPIYLASLEIDFLQHPEFKVQLFGTGEQCMEQLHNLPDIIVLDYYLNGVDPNAMNGMKTLDAIKERNPGIPVIILSSQDKIDVAVDCMHHKAYDYVIKNETAFLRLQKIIMSVFEFQKMEKNLNWYMDRM